MTARGKPWRKPWDGEFIPVDGEGWDGKYTSLALLKNGRVWEITNPAGLSTRGIVDFLFSHYDKTAAYVGYGMNYDFENMLVDLTDEEYRELKKETHLLWRDINITYIPRKWLEFQLGHTAIRICDAISFFQAKFITYDGAKLGGAVGKYYPDCPDTEILLAGKAGRGDFSEWSPEVISAYNAAELRATKIIMERLRENLKASFTAVGMKPNFTKLSWFGPGAAASVLLDGADYRDEFPLAWGAAIAWLRHHIRSPFRADVFAIAYYGGRIEAAVQGFIRGLICVYDINSAYPAAMAALPRFDDKRLRVGHGLDPAGRIGMYHITWALPARWDYYPFPWRSRTGNVFFPRRGEGWYMTPEVLTALATCPRNSIKVLEGVVLEGTEGLGQWGLLPSELASTVSTKIRLFAAHRLAWKAEGNPAAETAKLPINSVYGKTAQSVGNHKYRNFFVAAWITSWTRAKLWAAIADGAMAGRHETVSLMTDGIVSTVPVDLEINSQLGGWDEKDFTSVIQLLPGIYELRDGEKKKSKYRGLGANLDFEDLWRHLREHKTVTVYVNMFITRTLALAQPNRFGAQRLAFATTVEDETVKKGVKKVLDFALNSKRAGREIALPGQDAWFMAPKVIDLRQLAHPADGCSVGYKPSTPVSANEEINQSPDDVDITIDTEFMSEWLGD